MTSEELARLEQDLAAVAEPGPARSQFGPVLYDLFADLDEPGDDPGVTCSR